MSNLKDNLLKIRKTITLGVELVAVSKTQPVDAIKSLYDAGQRIFGENRVQEIIEKQPQLPFDIEWHFIGHLQSNKVKYISGFISMIQSVDSLKLLKEINNEAVKHKRIIDCLLEIHIATEESKYGLNINECLCLLESEDYKGLQNVNICGLMGMATFTDDMNLVRNEFKSLKTHFEYLKEKYFKNNPLFTEISMGMSGDYKIAIEEGSTIVRIGTALFGDK